MTRNDIVALLTEQGFTYREARKIVKVIIEEMKNALARGEDVHLPFGKIHPVKNKRSVRVWRFKKIVVQNKKKYRFHFYQKTPWE